MSNPTRSQNALSSIINKFRQSSIFRVSIASSLARLFGRAIGFVSRIIMARLLGAYIIGTFELSTSYMRQAIELGKFGIDRYFQIFIASTKDKKQQQETYSYVFTILLIIILLETTALFFISPWMANNVLHKPEMLWALRLAFAGVIPWVVFSFHNNALQGIKQTTISNILDAVVIPTITIILVLISKYILKIDSIYILNVIALMAISLNSILAIIIFLKKSNLHLKLRIYKQYIPKDFLSLSGKIYLVTLITVIGNIAVTTIQGVYCSLLDLGVFLTFQKLDMLLNVPAVSVVSTITPYIAEHHSENRFKKIQHLRLKSMLLIAGILIPIYVFLLVFKNLIFELLGKSFGGHSLVFIILATTSLITNLTAPLGITLVMAKKQKALAIITTLRIIYSIVATLVLVPKYGIVGLAIAGLTTVIFDKIMILITLKHYKL